MITFGSLICTALLPALIVVLVWVPVMFFLIEKVGSKFSSNDYPLSKHRCEIEELRRREIEYHNNAIYKAFEFYIKILIAVFAGIAFLVTKTPSLTGKARFLLDAAGWVVFLVGFLFAFLIFAHQKSKIERWKKKYSWYESLIWSELWLTASAIMIAMFTRFTMIPALLKR